MLALNGITSGELMLYPQLCDKKNKNKTRQNLLRYFFNLILVTQIVIFCGLAKATTAPASVNAPTALASLDLTEKERVWLAEHPVIRVANEPDFPPFDFISNGKPAGYSIEYVQLLAKRLGIRLEYVQDTWGNLLKKAEKKEVDLVHTVIDYPKERHSYLKFTRPYKEVVNAIVVRVDSEDIDELEDLDGRPVALIEGDSLVKPAKRVVPGMRDIYFKSYIDALKAVALGKVDATLIELPVASHYIRTLSLTNLKIVAETDTLKAQERLFHLAVRKDWAIFARILDKAMQSLSPAELRQLDEKWLAQPASLTVPKLNLTQQEKAWLAEHPVITLGGGVYAPLDYVNEDGTVVGIAPDYTESLIRPLGIKVNYMSNKSGNWGDLLEMLKEKKIDGIRHLQKTKEREEFAHFTKPITSFRYGIFVRNNTEDIFTLGDLSHKRVAVTKGSYAHTYLDKEYPDIEFAHYTNYSEALQALFNQDIDAIVGTIMAVGYVINEEFTTGFKVAGIIKEMNSYTNIGVRKDWPELASMMNKVYATITPEQHRQIKNKWIDLDIQPPTIALTPKEKAWLAEHPIIHIAPDPDFAPMEFIDELGQHSGITADFLKEIELHTGLKFQTTITESWGESLDAIKTGRVDMLPLIPTDPLEGVIFSKDYVFIQRALISNKNTTGQYTLEDLAGKEVVVVSGFTTIPYILENYPEIKLVEVSSTTEGISKVAIGEYDFMYSGLPSMVYYIRDTRLAGLRIASVSESKKYGAMMVREDWPELVSIINKALAVIPESTINNIYSKWIPLDLLESPKIELSAEEQAWLTEHPRLRMGFDAAYPPFEFLGEDGQHAGIGADYLKLIGERLGITIEPVYGLSWSEVLKKAERKELEIVSLLSKTEQRSQYLRFSKPFIDFQLVLVTRDDMPFVTGIEEFSGKKIALVSGYENAVVIPERYPEIIPLPKATPLDALKAVATGHAEGAVMDVPVAAYLIRKHSISNLKFAAPIQLALPPKSIGVRDDLPMLLGIIDKALASISEEERQAIRQKWIGLKYEKKIDYALIWKIIAVSVLLLVLLLLWSWQTRRQKVALKRAHDELELRVQERTAELASSEDRLKRTQAIGHVGSWVWNLNKGEMFWSDETYRILGYSSNKVDPSYELFFNRIHPDDRTLVSNDVEKALHEKVPYNFDFRIINESGLERVVNGQGDVASDASEKPVQLLGTIQDITERKQAEQALRESEEKLKTQFKGLSIPTYIWRKNGEDFQLIDYNDAGYEITQGNVEKIIGISAREYYSTPDQKQYADDISQCFASKEVIRKETTYTFKNVGVIKEFDITYVPLLPDLVMVHTEDITERKQAVEALKEERDKAQCYLDTVEAMMVALDFNGHITLVNRKACELLGYEEQELIGKNWFETCLPQPEGKEIIKQVFLAIINGNFEEAEYYENLVVTRHGEERFIAWHNNYLCDEDGKIIGSLSAGEDITERKQTEEKTQELLEQNRSLTKRLFGLQEAERRHLAQELHDELGQWLTAIQADAQLISNVTAQSDLQLHSSARAVLSNTNEVQKCVRDMIHQLRPSLLDELGLKESLREHVSQWQSQHTGTKCNISCHGDLDELGETLNITLYRIVQESLTNVAKHAQATSVSIKLENVKNSHSPATLMLTIQDDGKGMDVDKNYLGMGLPGMRERVLAAGGEFNIQSSPEKGMRIEACFPVTQQENVLLKPVYQLPC